MSWLVTVTEHVHQMREQLKLRWADPEWVKTVDLTPRMDHELLLMRGRYAKAMPGVEVQ